MNFDLVARDLSALQNLTPLPVSRMILRTVRDQGRTMTTIELEYDRLGSRLVRIGHAELTYDRLGSRPRRLGSLDIEYDRLGSRLRSIGSYGVDYSMLGNQPRMLGALPLDFGLLGLLRAVGPYDIKYGALGQRVTSIGPLTLRYEKFSAHPRWIDLPNGTDELPEDLLVIVFFTLDYLRRREDKEDKSDHDLDDH